MFTRSFATTSAFAEFPLSLDTPEGSRVPGADFQWVHLSNPVPDLCITSTICSQSFCRLATVEIPISPVSCKFGILGLT